MIYIYCAMGPPNLLTNHISLVGQKLNEIKCDPNISINHAAYLNWTLVEKQMEWTAVME